MTMKEKTRRQLTELGDALVDDVLETPDDVILREVEEDGRSPREAAATLRELVDETILRESTNTSDESPASVEVSSSSYRRVVRRIEAALAAGFELPPSIAAAIQAGKPLSDSAVDEVAEVLKVLGLADDAEPDD